MKKMYQPYHFVTISPWPLLMSLSLFIMFMSILNWLIYKNYIMMILSILLIMLIMFQWWRDIIRESTFQGSHSMKVVLNLKLGMMLFIISELFFFISIFWCYLHMFLSPSIEIGMNWPPLNLISFNPYNIPLLNTIILLSSGFSITWTHYSLINNNKYYSMLSLSLTIIMGMIFSYIQFLEYKNSNFSISDSVYGSIFFFSTGFHGLHVLIGSMFLLINLIRIYLNNYSSIHHFGFEASAWYWHFVDIVWLFLFLLVYIFPFN